MNLYPAGFVSIQLLCSFNGNSQGTLSLNVNIICLFALRLLVQEAFKVKSTIIKPKGKTKIFTLF